MAYTKYSLTPADNNAAPPNGAPEGMLPSAVNDTMRDMMSQIRDVGDGIRGGTYTMTAPVITGGSISGTTFSSSSATITGGTINGTTIGASTASTGKFTALTNSALTSGRVTYAGTAGVLQDDADFTFNGTTLTLANDASISGLKIGKGAGSDADSTALGALAINANTTGTQNSGAGWASLFANTTGSSNSGFGYGTLFTNTTGGSNTAIGTSALYSNTTASNNTAVGYQAAYNNNADSTTAIGAFALNANTSGTRNSSLGYASLYTNTTGASNVGIGYEALRSNTTASYNTAVGYQAGYSNTTGQVSAFGYQAGYSLTTGSNNVVFGTTALYTATTANANTALGHAALQVATASSNLGVGYLAGQGLTTGTLNTFVGSGAYASYGSGFTVTTGSRNTILGNYSGNQGGLDIRTASNYIVLSDGDGNPRQYFDGTVFVIPESSNTINYSITTNGTSRYVIHNKASADGSGFTYNVFQSVGSGVGSISFNGSGINYNTTSDYRLKENVVPMANALATIAKLKPCTYTWKESGETSQGFIAHELAEIFPNAVTGEKDAVDENGKINPQGIDTSYLVATLTSAIQELNAKVSALEAQLQGK